MTDRRNSGTNKNQQTKQTKTSQAALTWLCLTCDKAVEEDQGEIIQCFLCKEFCHKSCCGLTNAQFNACRGAKSVQWTCDNCGDKEVFVKSQIEAKLDGIFLLLKTMTERLEHLEAVHKNDNTGSKIEQTIEQKVNAYMLETEEKEKRKLNIIVSSLSESAKPTAEERKMDDIERVRRVINGIPEINSHEIENPIRLGTFKVGQNVRPRLLKLVVKTEETKKKILKGIINLNKTKAPNDRIYINHDNTPNEREKIKVLKAEIRQRLNDGESDLAIDYRSLKITKRQNRQGSVAVDPVAGTAGDVRH